MASNLCNSKNGAVMSMKLSIVLSTQPASFSALAYKGKLVENIAKIKGLGYDGVELAVRDPELLQLDKIDSLLKNNCLPVPAIGTGQAFGEEGLSFTNPDEKIRLQAIARIEKHMDLANHFGAVVIIGLLRGQNAKDVGTERSQRWLSEALAECTLTNQQVKIAIEPINRYETDLINTVSAGLRFIDNLKLDNVGLLLDSFHMNIEEPSITESIRMTGDRLFHFHVADSNRWHPGAGHINFNEILDTLDEIRYQGFVSAEILPMPDADTAAEKTIEYMRSIIG